MKNSTLKWIIGCLVGIIVILITYLIAKEKNVIAISFADGFSIAATVSSLILSVVAIFYTFLSANDSKEVNNKIQNTIDMIDKKVLLLSEEAKKNTQVLEMISETIVTVENAVKISANTIDVIKQENITEEEKKTVISNMENTKNSMMMFLERMKSTKEKG